MRGAFSHQILWTDESLKPGYKGTPRVSEINISYLSIWSFPQMYIFKLGYFLNIRKLADAVMLVDTCYFYRIILLFHSNKTLKDSHKFWMNIII
jgi:hypothetical protein